MKIKRLEMEVVRMRLAQPYTIAYEEVSDVTNVFVQLVTDRFVGVGCAAPDRAITGETPETVVRALRDVAEPRLLGQEPFRWRRLIHDLREPLEGHSSALAAVDMALFDLLGKACDRPLWQLLGGFRDRAETSVTIGILPELETIEAARTFAAQGFRCLKIKGGLDVESDVARVVKVREAVGPGASLRFDANQGYSAAQSIRFVEGVRTAQLELLEQPTVAGQPRLLGEVTATVDLPVMADESLKSLRDAFRLAEQELVDMVNIKVMKVGGLSRAMQIDSVAQAGRLESMVGCFDESEAGIAAGLALALARPNVAYADLDGHLDLVGDPASGSLTLRDGFLLGPDRPGLGIELTGL